MSRSAAPVFFAAVLVAGLALGFLTRSAADHPDGPPDAFVFFDEETSDEYYADQQRQENINHGVLIALISIGVVGLAVVGVGRLSEGTS